MRDLEQLLRDELTRLAGEARTAVPLAERVRAARRRRTRAWLGAAAAAVVLAVGGAGVALHRVGVEPVDSGATSNGAATDAGTGALLGFRLEVWHGIGVYVPATWGWGGAPGACGAMPTVGADGHRLSGDEVLAGYVGRPIAQTSHCRVTDPTEPLTPYVWLGADVPVGARRLGGGWVQETRRVGGTTVTVGTQDAGERRSLLASAHVVVGGPCAASLPDPPSVAAKPSGQGSGHFEPTSMTVCAYASSSSAGSSPESSAPYELLYEEQLAAGPAKQLVAAVAAAAPMGEHSCFGASGGEWALLHLEGSDGSRDYVVDLSCPSIADPSGLQHELTSADMLPWAVDGVNAVLHGSPLVDVPGHLIGG